MAQGSQLVSPLPPASWPIMSQRDNEIYDVLDEGRIEIDHQAGRKYLYGMMVF